MTAACPHRLPQLGEEGAINVFSSKHNKWHAHKFDRVFGEDSTQDDVYAETQPLIRSVLDGGLDGGTPPDVGRWLWVVVCRGGGR